MMGVGTKIAVASTSIAAAGFFLLVLLPDQFPLEWSVAISLCLAIVWAGAFVSCLVRFGKRGLWVLAGAPFVLFWPFYFFTFLWIAIW